MKKIISLKKLNYKNILTNLNIEFYENKVHYISGSNNCGKTTLFKILSGKIKIDEGIFYKEKRFNEINLSKLSQIIGVVTDIEDQFHFTTVRQELFYQLDKLELKSTEYKQTYKEILDFLDLKPIINKNISDLTHYEKLKLVLAIELSKKPKILLLNNLFIYMNKKEQIKIMEYIKQLKGMTIIIFNTDLELATYSDYLHLLHKGELILSGPAIAVFEKDSIINKLGLELPFMVDLSLKLKYYNLNDAIELEMNRMVDNLWK